MILFSFSRSVGLVGPLIILTGLLSWASSASATARITLEARGEAGGTPPYSDRQDIAVSGAVADGGSVATGLANLDAGILRASAVSVGGGGLVTSAESVINDTFRFSDGASGTAYLDWSIDGTASAAEGLDLSFGVGVLLFYWVAPGAGVAEELIYAYTSSGFICDALLVETSCSVGSSFAAQGSIPLPITSGDYFLQTALQSQARDGTSNFGNSARLYLRTPDGVTIDSASGRFLASATPISAVPESSANALLLAGLGVLGFVARRRRNR